MEATAWIALIALGFTGAQAWIAHRKLRFDLYSKRFEVWDGMNVSINEYVSEISKNKRSAIEPLYSDKLKDIWAKRRSMISLFPPDVLESLNYIEIRLTDYAIATASMHRDAGDNNFDERYKAYITAEGRVRDAQAELGNRVHRYIRQYGL
ncbi:hypothetical protein ABEV34_07535, partial [Methylorubrum rhodesianum]|uniref:hypothetical protein n=1 Tax=Methylorubrum rhodesianum TaxID=29427 RepID=UPI003D2A2000